MFLFKDVKEIYKWISELMIPWLCLKHCKVSK